MHEYLGVVTEKRGTKRRCPVDHKIHHQAVHDIIAKMGPVCVGAKGAQLSDEYLADLQRQHDLACKQGADCPVKRARELIAETADKAAVLKACLAQPRGLGRDALPSACADTLRARLQLCHQVPRSARSGHDLFKR